METKKLIAMAEEINTVLGLEPKINVKAPAPTLTTKLTKAFELIMPEDDLSEDTKAGFREMGLGATKHEEEEEMEEEMEEEEEVEEIKKKTKSPIEKEDPKETPKETPKKATKKGPGVIATIADVIEKGGTKGVSKEEILEVLVKTFPDKAKESMKNTINVQVPNRISKEKFVLIKLDTGNFCKK